MLDDKKRDRGRPSVTEKIAGSSASHYEAVITSGKKYRSRRSISDSAYTIIAARILSEAASEIEDLKLIFDSEADYVCRSVLSQLGRMAQVDGYSENEVIEIAKEAIKGKKSGYSVKEIEKYIRHGRVTGEWQEKKRKMPL
jgi:hypothetical protein